MSLLPKSWEAVELWNVLRGLKQANRITDSEINRQIRIQSPAEQAMSTRAGEVASVDADDMRIDSPNTVNHYYPAPEPAKSGSLLKWGLMAGALAIGGPGAAVAWKLPEILKAFAAREQTPQSAAPAETVDLFRDFELHVGDGKTAAP